MDLDDLTPHELDQHACRDAARLAALARSAVRTEREIAERADLWAGVEGPMLTADQRRDALRLLDRVLDLQRGYHAVSSAHQGFWRIGPGDDLPRHARHFALHAGAYLGRLAVGLALVQPTLGKPHFERLFDEGCEEVGLWQGSFSRLKWDVVHLEHAPRVAAARAYHRLMKASLWAQARWEWMEPVLDEIERAHELTSARMLSQGPSLLAGNALEILRGAAQRAAMPVQSSVAEWLGDTRVLRLDGQGLISAQQAAALARVARPGDLVFERRNWYLSNVGLPGFWPHVALWLGSPHELSASLDHEPSVRAAYGGAFTAALRARYPAAFAQYERPDEHGHPRRLIEAVAEGVLTASAEHSLGADYAAGLRPRRPPLEAARAIEQAFACWGRPYDFDFDFHTDSALVCSELVYKSWEPRQGVEGLRLDLVEVLGRPTLPPNEIIAQFDREHGTAAQQLDFVFFLDGVEASGRAEPADEAALRASWRRPKWDIAQR